jgi:hypothetical protein
LVTAQSAGGCDSSRCSGWSVRATSADPPRRTWFGWLPACAAGGRPRPSINARVSCVW